MANTLAISKKRFRVALSFPGEKRDFIKQVADALAAALGKDRVLYDDYLIAELACLDLDLYLGSLYRDQSELLVPFYCAEYEKKKWCKLEWRQMRDILLNVEGHRIMPFRFDDSPIAGVLSIDGHVKIGARSPKEVAHLILQRLGQTATSDAAIETRTDSVISKLQRLADLMEAAGINDAVRKLAADSSVDLAEIYADVALEMRPMTIAEKHRFEQFHAVSASGGQTAERKRESDHIGARTSCVGVKWDELAAKFGWWKHRPESRCAVAQNC